MNDKSLLGKEIDGIATRYNTSKDIEANAEKEEAILGIVKKFPGIVPQEIISAIMRKEILCSRVGFVKLIDVQGWFQEYLAKLHAPNAPSWLQDLYWDGHGHMENVFSKEEIFLLDMNMMEIFEANTEKQGEPKVAFDRLTHTGELVLERVQELWNSPLRWILGHPIFDYISETVFKTTDWVPYVCMGLYKHPHSVKTLAHRDTHWCLPEIYRNIRFLCQIQFNNPEEGDGGLLYQPRTHFLQEDRHMISQGAAPATLTPCKGQTPYDINFHNVGCLHGVKPNMSDILVKRLYIGILPLEESAIYNYYVNSMPLQDMKNLIQTCKEEYKSLF